jgi:hypothetical protein
MEKPLKAYKRRWNARAVYLQQNKGEIFQQVQDDAGDKPGGEAFLGALQPTVTRMYNALTTSEKAAYGTTSNQWNSAGVPREVQIR